MEPKIRIFVFIVNLEWLAHQNALKDLCNVSEIEGVMELGRDW